jgi:hypothetical protein
LQKSSLNLCGAVLKTLTGLSDKHNWSSDPGTLGPRAGVRAFFLPGKLSMFQVNSLEKMGHLTAWGTDQNSVKGKEYIHSQGFFPGGAPADV